MPPKHPNVLMVWTDEQRADTLACYGADYVNAPNLNRLASQSVVFENAYCAQPVCTPSRGTIMSGLWPKDHGATFNNVPINQDTRVLPEMFTEGDYHTAYFGKWHLGDEVIQQHGFHEWHAIEDEYRSFYTKPEHLKIFSPYHHYLEKNGFQKNANAADGAAIFSRGMAALLPERFTKAGWLGQQVVRFIEDRPSGQPWFASVNFLEPHMPFWGPLNDAHNPDDLPVGPAFNAVPPDNHSLRNRYHTARFRNEGFHSTDLSTEAGCRRMRANYYGLVTLVDQAVGQMLDALEAAGQAENTIVVFTSDHGDMMGDWSMVGKGVMYEPSVRIPWFVRVPWLQTAGRTAPGRVSQIDFAPTLLELMGQPLPQHLAGQSRADVIRGDATLEGNDAFVIWDGRDGVPNKPQPGFDAEDASRVGEQRWRTIISADGWKLARCATDQCELFNLNEDPHELTNRFDDPDQRSRVDDMTSRLTAWQQRTNDTCPI